MEDADEEKALDSAKANGALFEPAKPQPGDFDYVEPGQDLRSPWPELGRGFEPFEDEVRSKQPAEHTLLTAAAPPYHPASCCLPASNALQAMAVPQAATTQLLLLQCCIRLSSSIWKRMPCTFILQEAECLVLQLCLPWPAGNRRSG